jgi:peptidyl-prolyl cis-trans isomerase D
MINKLAKAQKSWVAKLILTLTALSFMSLFGVTGYINSAGNNRTVIKVDGIETTQAQFAHQTQKELAEAKKLLGEDYEMSDDMQTALIYEQVQKIVQNSILDRMAQKYDVAFRPEMLGALIRNQSRFKDASGNFNNDLFRRELAENDMTEGDLIAGVKRDLTRRLLVDLPVANLTVPAAATDILSQIDNKRRTFSYIQIDPKDVKIDRRMTEEETEQYYEDFQANYIEPERRDVTVLYLTASDAARRMKVTDEDIKAYYDEHKSDYETPQKRQILQMMFSSKEDAEAAYDSLKNGADFYQIAQDKAGQSREDTELGYAAQDELLENLGEAVFHLFAGEFTEPVETGDSWQIMKVTDIKEATAVPYVKAAAEIADLIRQDGVYEELDSIANAVEDGLGEGKSLEDISKDMDLPLAGMKNLAEDGSASFVAHELKSLTESTDFLDTVFSYALDETSRVVDTEGGIVALRVDKITAAHPKPIEEVRGEIQTLWAQNEKTAIVQEMLNDINHDLENGDDLAQIAKRYDLEVYHSQPITRNETFADINYVQIREMFVDPLNTPHQVQKDDVFLIAVADHDYKNSAPLTDSEKNLVQFQAKLSMTRDFRSALLAAYAADYKIRVKYKLIGIED